MVEAAWEDEAREQQQDESISSRESLWDDEDAESVTGSTMNSGETRSVVVKRSESVDLTHDDPFDHDSRIAQRPDELFDPFEEPEGEPLTELPVDEPGIEREPSIEPLPSELETDEPARDPVFDETLERDPLDFDDARDPLQRHLEDLVPSVPEEIIRPYQQPVEEMLAREVEEAQRSCEAEMEALEADTIDKVDLSIRLDGTPGQDFPYECHLTSKDYQPRQWPEITYNWKASALCHKPLYFEQRQLERYGHSWRPCVQPIVSGAHFFGSIFILPYKMGIETPNECIYTLGYYRPGNCAPYMIEAMPFTWRAAMFQTGAVTATAFIVP